MLQRVRAACFLFFFIRRNIFIIFAASRHMPCRFLIIFFASHDSAAFARRYAAALFFAGFFSFFDAGCLMSCFR